MVHRTSGASGLAGCTVSPFVSKELAFEASDGFFSGLFWHYLLPRYVCSPTEDGVGRFGVPGVESGCCDSLVFSPVLYRLDPFRL